MSPLWTIKGFLKTLHNKLTSYFETNIPGEVSNQAVWEAHKVVIRGEMIAQGSRLRNEKQNEMTDLLEEKHKLEIKHKSSRNPGDANRLEELRLNLTRCLDLKVKNKQRYYAHRFYEQDSKGGKLLARQLKKQQEARHVHKLVVNYKQITDTQKIAAEFQRYYKSLDNIDSVSAGAVDGGALNKIREYIRSENT